MSDRHEQTIASIMETFRGEMAEIPNDQSAKTRQSVADVQRRAMGALDLVARRSDMTDLTFSRFVAQARADVNLAVAARAAR